MFLGHTSLSQPHAPWAEGTWEQAANSTTLSLLHGPCAMSKSTPKNVVVRESDQAGSSTLTCVTPFQTGLWLAHDPEEFHWLIPYFNNVLL